MKNRKSVMALSALLILFFHLWISFTVGNTAEQFIKQTAYIGVDMFFFLSAYSLASREVKSYGRFVWARFQSVYIKFILFAIVAAIASGWSILRLLKTVCMYDLFTKGGGAFLWFLPAIMLFYLIFPLFQRADKKHPVITFVVAVVIWAGVAALLSFATSYTKIFILWNRIPVFLLGFYWKKVGVQDWIEKRWQVKLGLGILEVAVGYVLLYYLGYTSKIQLPFTDMFYVFAMDAAVGLILLSSFIPERGVITWIGSSTLEIYAIQMIFGYRMMNRIFMATNNKIYTNVLTILLVLVIAIVVHYVYAFVEGKIKKLLC